MKKYLSLFLIALALIMASCSNDNDENYATMTTDMINRVTLVSTGSTGMYAGTYQFYLDFANAKTNITVTTKFAAQMPEVTFMVKDLPLTASSSTGYSFTASSVTPVDASGTAVSGYTITNLKGQILDGVVKLQYTVNGTFQVQATSNKLAYTTANTTVTDTLDATKIYKNTEMQYGIIIDAAKDSAVLYLANAKFDANMPVQSTMTFPHLVATPTATGYILTGNNIVPTISGVPFKSYLITNFLANLYYDSDKATISFECAGKKVEATGYLHAQ
jgi:hypothetical protein